MSKAENLRCFHASSELLARRMDDESIGLKKFSKRNKETKPFVDAPYVPPKLKRYVKSLPNKTIEIFEGMTIVELAKRRRESISTIQNIIINVGERADSEFGALSIDIAELVAMEVGVNVHRLHSDEDAQTLCFFCVIYVLTFHLCQVGGSDWIRSY